MPAWTEANDRKLLVAIIQSVQTGTISKEQWAAIAEKMGEGFTVGGISQRYSKKLLKENIGAGPPSPTKVSTPKSSKAKPKGSANKRKKDAEVEDDDEDSSPLKKTKGGNDGIKAEDAGDGD